MALQPSSVRRLFLAAFVVLPLQYALVGLIGLRWSEPWPALVMPGFQTVYRPDHITADVFRFEVRFSDGTRARCTPADVLADLPRSHHDAVMQLRFRASGNRAAPPTPEAREALAAWLGVQLQRVFPSHTPVQATIVRDQVLVVSDALAPRRTVTPMDSLTFALR